MGQHNTIAEPNGAQWFRKVAKLHRKLVEVYEEKADDMEEKQLRLTAIARWKWRNKYI